LLRVTADTNVLISGINYRAGKPFQILELARTGKINLTVSDAILDEMEDVLRRKFSFSPEESAEARRRIRAISRTVVPAITLDVIKEDPPDNRILECGVAAGSDFIVTGDKDLLRLGRYDSIRILTPSNLMDIALGTAQER
jgi:putative PIN family toxin of toxin-antitoxin system